MGALDRLKDLNAAVSAITATAGEAATALASTSTAADAAVNSLGALMTSSNATREAVVGNASAISESTVQIVDEVNRAAKEVKETLDKTTDEAATRLDDLYTILNKTKNSWDKDLILMIEGVKLGLVPLQELLDKYGEANIQGRRLFEFLGGIPIDTYTQRVQAFINAIRDGRGTLVELKAFLAQTDLEFAKSLSEAIDLFRQGKGTLQAVADLVKNIEQTFGDTQFADLASAVLNALNSGGLR